MDWPVRDGFEGVGYLVEIFVPIVAVALVFPLVTAWLKLRKANRVGLSGGRYIWASLVTYSALTRHVDCLLRVVSGTIISPSQRGRLTIMHRASVLAGLIVLFKGSQPLPAAQVKATHPAVVTLPRPAVSRIPSPNGRWTLIFECPNDCSERKLWLEEKVSHTRKLVKEYDRSLSISWSPDSHLFFVNDASGSTETRCYVYDPATLKETDLARVVLTGDPDAAQFLNAGHSYLEAKQWVNSHELLVLLEGHNDGAPPGSFTLRYRVDLSGTVRKLSQHSEQ